MSPFVVARSWRARTVESGVMLGSTTSALPFAGGGILKLLAGEVNAVNSIFIAYGATHLAQQALLLRRRSPRWVVD